MTLEEALPYFISGYHLCKSINIDPSNYSKWKKNNWIPVTQQLKINQVTGANMPIDLDQKELAERLKIEGEQGKG